MRRNLLCPSFAHLPPTVLFYFFVCCLSQETFQFDNMKLVFAVRALSRAVVDQHDQQIRHQHCSREEEAAAVPPLPPRCCLPSVCAWCCWICLQIFLSFYFYCCTAVEEGSKERKAFLLLLVLFLVNAKQLAMVAEAGTLPTEYGFVNSEATSVSLDSEGYTGTLPTELGLMTAMASSFNLQTKK